MGFKSALGVKISGTPSRARWSAMGAAVAISLGAGGVAVTHAVVSSGERAVYIPIAPCRLFDLRPAPDQVGPRSAPLGPDETFTHAVRGTNGNCTIPADATAVSMNVTAVGGSAPSYLTIWPSDVSPRPQASNLNWLPSSPPTPNKVDVKLSADGNINFFNFAGNVGVIADVVGYYADHNHDDRYYTQAQSNAQLAAKANAADVYTKAQINGLPSSSVVAGGIVRGDGTVLESAVRFGSAWTVTRTGTGQYSITLQAINPGCASAVPFPLTLASSFSFAPGFEVVFDSVSTACASGDTRVFVRTYDVLGALSDRGFQFIAYKPGSNQVLPVAARAGATQCTAYADGTVTCT